MWTGKCRYREAGRAVESSFKRSHHLRDRRAMGGSLFYPMAEGFNEYHANALNVALHLITTPAGYLGALALVAEYAGGATAVDSAAAVYCLALLCMVPLWIALATSSIVAGLAYAATRTALAAHLGGWMPAAALLAFSYVGQDVSHWMCGEPTFQSTYMKRAGWLSALLEHTFFLLPCVLGAIPQMDTTFLFWLVPMNYVVKGKVADRPGKAKLAYMRQWVMDQSPSKEHTTHWWFQTLAPEPKAAFDYLSKCDACIGMFRAKYPANLWNVEVHPLPCDVDERSPLAHPAPMG